MRPRPPAVLAAFAGVILAAACAEGRTPSASAASNPPAGAKPASEVAMQAELGKPAPAFTATDSNGTPRSLGEFAGKVVVLEWNNPECPFVKKHYGSGNMQSLQKELTGKGTVWLSILSSAPGKQGHMNGEQANAMLREKGAAPTAYLLDPDGAVGRLYGAKTTPHMYVIDAKGTLVYAGGIDDKPSANAADVEGAKNYVRLAVDELLSGKPVSVTSSQPYGCSVKY